MNNYILKNQVPGLIDAAYRKSEELGMNIVIDTTFFHTTGRRILTIKFCNEWVERESKEFEIIESCIDEAMAWVNGFTVKKQR